MRQILIQAVEAALGWQFVASHALVKIPGFTEPANLMSMNTVAKNALAMQLASQIDDSDTFSIEFGENSRVSVKNSKPKVNQPDCASVHGDSRAVNAIKAIYRSGFIGPNL